jgi:hypothetical protein
VLRIDGLEVLDNVECVLEEGPAALGLDDDHSAAVGIGSSSLDVARQLQRGDLLACCLSGDAAADPVDDSGVE